MSWSNVALSTLVDIKGGGTPSKANPEYWNGSIPWASVKDFKSSDLNGASDYITQEGIDNSATSLIPRGNLIVPTRMALGKIAINSVDIAINQDLKALIIKDESVVDTEYLFRCIQSKSEEIVRQGKGATVKGITVDVLKNLQIPLPPLETQKKIAKVLEQADQLRKDCKLLEQELNSLAQSVFIDMFGDVRSNSFNSKKVKFDDIFEINSKLVDPRLPEFENLPHIGPEHLEKRTGRILPYRTAKEDALVSGKFNFQKGCVLFSKIRPNLKKVAIPEFSGLCSADMYPLEAIDGVSTREFIWGLILSDAFDDYLETLPSRANIPKINRKELAAFEFYLPDLRDQKAYSKKLAKIQEQLKQNACLYQETENNFNALIQKAFKGELTL